MDQAQHSSLLSCRDQAMKILGILNEMKKEDTTEVYTTLQMVQITINTAISTKANYKTETLSELRLSLKDLQTILDQSLETNRLVRILRNTRLRANLEETNMRIHKKLMYFRDSVRRLSVKPNELQLNGRATIPPDESFNINMFTDPDGKKIWSELFGLDTFMIEWTTFLNSLKKLSAFQGITPDEATVLHFILDQSNTGNISSHRFSELLKGFGPINSLISNIRKTLSAPWFYGFLSRTETELLLRRQPQNTFLIRFSSSSPGSFVMVYVQEDGRTIAHILLNNAQPNGYRVEEEGNPNPKIFGTLQEVVDYYSFLLKTPFQSDLPFESWFEGEMNTVETTEALSGNELGTFVVRFSTQSGSYTISFVDPERAIAHCRIEHEGVPNNMFRMDHDGKWIYFSTLQEVVAFFREALNQPLKQKTNKLAIQANRVILLWKNNRAKIMESIVAIVEDMYNPKNIPKTEVPKVVGRSQTVSTPLTKSSSGTVSKTSVTAEERAKHIVDSIFEGLA